MESSSKKQNAITIYDSFQAQKEDEIRASLKLSPQERLKQTVDLILRAYATSREELKKRPRSNQIKVINNGYQDQ